MVLTHGCVAFGGFLSPGDDSSSNIQVFVGVRSGQKEKKGRRSERRKLQSKEEGGGSGEYSSLRRRPLGIKREKMKTKRKISSIRLAPWVKTIVLGVSDVNLTFESNETSPRSLRSIVWEI